MRSKAKAFGALRSLTGLARSLKNAFVIEPIRLRESDIDYDLDAIERASQTNGPTAARASLPIPDSLVKERAAARPQTLVKLAAARRGATLTLVNTLCQA
jgi:hypothetical protein